MLTDQGSNNLSNLSASKSCAQCMADAGGGGGGGFEMCPVMKQALKFGLCLYICNSGGVESVMKGNLGCPPSMPKGGGMAV